MKWLALRELRHWDLNYDVPDYVKVTGQKTKQKRGNTCRALLACCDTLLYKQTCKNKNKNKYGSYTTSLLKYSRLKNKSKAAQKCVHVTNTASHSWYTLKIIQHTDLLATGGCRVDVLVHTVHVYIHWSPKLFIPKWYQDREPQGVPTNHSF